MPDEQPHGRSSVAGSVLASWPRFLPWLACLGTVLAAQPGLGQQVSALYAKEASLQATMLATRARLESWRAIQADARAAIHIGLWYRTSLGGGQELDAAAVTQNGIGLDTKGKKAGPHWQTCRTDKSQNPVLRRSKADYLYTVITADRPVTLTVEPSRHERFGGFAYRPPRCGAGVRPTDALVWLNGQQLKAENHLAGYRSVPVAKRRGWHDAVMIALPLKRGENRVLLSLRKGGKRPWFNAVRLTPNPVPALWAMIENDFPRSSHRLLERVNHTWFDAENGWLSENGEPRLERQLLKRELGDLGPDGATIARRRDELTTANAAASDPRWLDLAITAAELHAGLGMIDALKAAVGELHGAFPERYPGGQFCERAADLRAQLIAMAPDRLDPADEQSRRLLSTLRELRREALVAKNPLLAGKKLLLVKRHTYDSDHYYDEFIQGIRRFGGNLCLLSIDDGALSEIAPELSGGIFDRYDLSFDARRIAFNYKPHEPGGFRIYEIGVDGTNLRQLTFPAEDEPQRIATYATCSWKKLKKNPCRYGHWTDDMHPCYLPDGRIVFTSTRSERSVLCGGHALTVTNLHRVNADGTGLHMLSQGALSEFCPTVMHDGRIMYNRWEYVDKGAAAVHALWAMCPDGSRAEEVYGDNITTPGVFNQARHVPGRNNLVVCLGAAHCPGNMGAILLVDLHKNKRSEEAMTALTPGCVPKGNWGLRQMRNGRWITDIYGPWYCDPFPLGDPAVESIAGKFFLVSCNPESLWNDPAAYGIYLLDVFGNRVPIYDDPEMSCWQARPLAPRRAPPVLADSAEPSDAADAREATMLVTDVYRGLEGVQPGAVKYLRVMEQVPRPWSVHLGYQRKDAAPGQMVAVSLYAHLSVKVLHGVVPVREDGSALFTVPADRNIFLEALDEDFMEIQRMRTFVNFQPGESRSCIGCHEHRNQVPAVRRPKALDFPPEKLRPQPGDVAARPIHYASDIQPIFDRHCVSCHGAEKTDGELDLSGKMTKLFCRSYEQIIHKDLAGHIQEFVGPKPEAKDATGYASAVPPYTYGSHRSKLIEVLRKGHYDIELPREDFVKLVTWVDANAPYYGSYFGRRHIAFRNQPEFRPVPTLESAQGVRPTTK